MNDKQILPQKKQSLTIDRALVSSLYELSVKSQLSTLVYTILVIIFLYPELTYSIVIWGSGLFIFTLFRLYTIYLFKTDYQRFSLQTWYKIFAITSLLTATILSLLGVVFIYYLSDFYQLFVAAILVAATSVSTTSLSSDFRIAIAYIAIILVPLIISVAIVEFPAHYVLSLLLLLLFTAQITMILNNYRQGEKIKELLREVKRQTEHNEQLLDDNKQFIADMVHQIRTPMSVIMTNVSLVEMQGVKKNLPYLKQINSAINMLSNSYEDLSYIISHDTINYKPVEIDLSDFLSKRIDFFEVVAQANSKTISTNISSDLTIVMNDTELERLIDNNISNAIKHSDDNSRIEIVLEKTDLGLVLKFISEGKSISNASKVFDKNYTENSSAKRSFGLGLHMVKKICEKNGIGYSARSTEGINTFTYIFNV